MNDFEDDPRYDHEPLQPGDIDPDNERRVERVTGTFDDPVIVYEDQPPEEDDGQG